MLGCMYSWKEIDAEAQILDMNRSQMMQRMVLDYFLNKRRNKLRTNYSEIMLGLLLVVCSIILVMQL